HGWVGDNPNGYSTDNGFHAYIDGKILEIHHLDYESLKGRIKFDTKVSPGDPWSECLAHIQRSYDQVEPLYKMQKDGSLTKETGKELISDRLCDAGSMLAALYDAAWSASKPSDSDIANFIKYSEQRSKRSEAPKTPAPA